MIKQKIRSIKVDDTTWEEIDRVSKSIGCSKSAFLRMAGIEKIQRIERSK